MAKITKEEMEAYVRGRIRREELCISHRRKFGLHATDGEWGCNDECRYDCPVTEECEK